MAVIMTEINGVLCSSLDEYGYLLCDHQCQGCVANGRCEAQNDNNDAWLLDFQEWLNSDEHHEEVKKQRDDWFASEAFPSGPEHCWGCENEGLCTVRQMRKCMNEEPDWDYKMTEFVSPWKSLENLMAYKFDLLDIEANPPF